MHAFAVVCVCMSILRVSDSQYDHDHLLHFETPEFSGTSNLDSTSGSYNFDKESSKHIIA